MGWQAKETMVATGTGRAVYKTFRIKLGYLHCIMIHLRFSPQWESIAFCHGTLQRETETES